MRQETQIQRMSGVTIRKLGQADVPAVVRLVQLDSAEVPSGELVGAYIEDQLVALAPVAGGEIIADPFSRTSELRALLELRAAQLRGRQPQRRRFGLFARRPARLGRPSAPTPPGAVSLRPY